MRHLLHLILLCALGWALTGCIDTTGRDCAYHLSARLCHGDISCDSAALFVLDDDYAMLRSLSGTRLHDSTFTFAGHIAQPQIACASFFAHDSLLLQFYFVLEPTSIVITFEPGQWLIEGGIANREYQLFLNHLAHVQAQRDSLWQHYVRMGADSTLTWDAERCSLRTDSILQDSLQRLTVDRINRGDLVSRLVKQRLLHTLTRESLNSLSPPSPLKGEH